MRIAVLGSGSGGNAVLVASGEDRLLLDAGFSCRQIETRMALLGEEAADLQALVLTHEHSDHVRGVGRLVRRHALPLYATAGTLGAPRLAAGLAAAGKDADDDAPRVTVVRSGHAFEIPGRDGGFRLEPFTVPHDAAEPVGFVVEDAHGARLGLLSDLGSRTQLAWGRLRDLDCLILETNHDLTMLRNGPYPWYLKQRVAGRHGHLSNQTAAEGLPELVSDRLRHVVLYHLSKTNNLPALAADTVGEALDRVGAETRVVLSRQDQPTEWVEVTSTWSAAS